MRKGYRKCTKCGRNRAERFFVSAAGRTCSTCRRGRVRHAGRETHLQETKGISNDEYLEMLAVYDGACWICKGKRPYNLDVDHDHALEKALLKLGVPHPLAVRLSIRGLLCKPCNRRLLPSVHDDKNVLLAAIAYLSRLAYFSTEMADAVHEHSQGSDGGRGVDPHGPATHSGQASGSDVRDGVL